MTLARETTVFLSNTRGHLKFPFLDSTFSGVQSALGSCNSTSVADKLSGWEG